ncbi:MAG: hypothetical protein U9N32_08825 [Spirochaetota bacterium]|nr:hypothetical protein [Spirochaetota bacterium]
MKFASPSAGVFSQKHDLSSLARAYEQGAQAISILTDEKFFSGKKTGRVGLSGC